MMLDNLTGFHIEPTNICTLKCSKCERTELRNKFPSKWSNQNLNLDNFINFIDIDVEGKLFTLCGNSGDPIYYPDLFELCQFIKLKKAHIKIITNGSYKTKEWWQKLAGILTENDTVVFSIDGLPNNFTIYRQNGDWESISAGIAVLSQTNVNTVWKYIVFKYNENDIEQACKLSDELGIKFFQPYYSDRWDINDPLKPSSSMISRLAGSKQMWKKGQVSGNITPKCLITGQMHYISSTGVYHPCCFIANSNFYYKSEFFKNRNHLQIQNTTLSETLKNPMLVNFYNKLLLGQGADACTFNCPQVNSDNQPLQSVN